MSAETVAELPADFSSEILALIVWEKFEYVYGEGGERREGFRLAPPRLLERRQLNRLGALSKSLPYSRKTIEGEDQGSWERGHRPHGLILVSANGRFERFLAKSDPPRDFEIAWREHSSGQLSKVAAAALAVSLSCPVLTEDGEPCKFGPLAVFFSPKVVEYHEPGEKAVLTLDFDAGPSEAAASFLQAIEIGS